MATTTGAELLNAIKSYATGAIRGNTVDTVGAPVDIVNEILAPVMGAIGIPKPDKPIGGSKHLRDLMGIPTEDANIAETAGGMLSIGGAAKAMILGAGRLAATGKIPKESYDLAFKMKGENASNADIFSQTSIYFDKGVAKTVASDKDTKLTTTANTAVPGTETSLPKFMEAPELQGIYSKLDEMTVQKTELPGRVRGQFLQKHNLTDLSSKLSPTDLRGTLLHEIQHAIQNIEGWQGGGSPKQFLPANFDPARIQAKVVEARKSSDPSVRDAAERLKVSANKKLSEAHTRYENLPGEQEARFTEATKDLDITELSTRLLKMLRSGDTPSNFDTKPIRTIPPVPGK